MIRYRTFKNFDPPKLVRLWNAALAGRRAVPIPGRGTTLLEYFYLAKPGFDPKGLIIAEDDAEPVGFIHASFARSGEWFDFARGLICTLGVVPPYRRKGVGSELLRLAGEYLKAKGATSTLAGPMAPDNPFTFGLYGGGDSFGFCDSDEAAGPFFKKHGFLEERTQAVCRRVLEKLHMPADVRFPGIRQQYEIIAAPYARAGLWRECALGPVEAVEYRLQEKGAERVVARTVLWDMETFYQGWGSAGVGMLDLFVEPAERRKGLAKYLLAQVLRHLREQPFHLFEIGVDLDNVAGLGLLKQLHFEKVDTGRRYARQG